MRKIFTTTIATFLIFCFGQSQTFDSLITDYVSENRFNGTILVNKNDSILFYKNFGLANREFNILIDNHTRFKIASITKLFTSVLILQLHDKGKINLDNTIGNYLPDYKGEGADSIKIINLLTATSGLEDMEKNGDEVYEKRFTTDDILKNYCSGKLINQPGMKFFYNNADFVILGKIIESITNSSFSDAIKQHILVPLQMTNTGVFDYKIIENLADCYWFNDSTGNIEKDIPYYIENYYSSGAMYSTAVDLMTFSNALFSGKLLSDKSIEILLKPYHEKYACGLWAFDYWINDNLQYKVAFRLGNIWGAETVLIRLLEKDINIIILSNMMGTSDMRDLQYKIINNINNLKYENK